MIRQTGRGLVRSDRTPRRAEKEAVMKRSWTWIIPALLIATGIGLGLFAGPLDAQQKNVLVAKKVAAPPTLDGVMEDAWKSAPELEVTVRGGRNLPEGKTEVKLRSVYSGDTVYFLMQYKDATESLRRGPWEALGRVLVLHEEVLGRHGVLPHAVQG